MNEKVRRHSFWYRMFRRDIGRKVVALFLAVLLFAAIDRQVRLEEEQTVRIEYVDHQDVEAREQELASKMQDNHPQLQSVRQQVADLRAILADQPTERLQATEAVNPARQALELSLLNEQSLADSLVARGRELAALRQELQRDLQRLNANDAV